MSIITGVVLSMLAAYALGSVLGGSVIGWLRQVDLRANGSGNIGATNALRTQGMLFALAVLALDIGKGVVAVLILPSLTGAHPPSELPYACGAAAAMGHCYPVWHNFKGGKGVATLAGVFTALIPVVWAPTLAVFVLVVLLTGIVSLATFAATGTVLLYVACFSATGLFSSAGAFVLAMSALVVFKHRDNIMRLAKGTEHRFERARLLGRLFDRRHSNT